MNYQVEKLKTKPFLQFQRLYLIIYLLAFTGVSINHSFARSIVKAFVSLSLSLFLS